MNDNHKVPSTDGHLMPCQYIIDTTAQFRGICQSAVDNNGIVMYSDGQTVAEYLAKHGDRFRAVPEAEYFDMVDAYQATLVTLPEKETREEFWNALEVLPPERWHNHRGVELFCMCEYLTGNLTAWHAELNGQHYAFTDHANASSEHLASKVAAASA